MAKRARTPRSSNALSTLSFEELRAEFGRRQRRVGALESRRARLVEKLGALDADIRALGGTVNGGVGGRRRPRNESNLVEALATLLDGTTMSVTEAAEEVQKAGYRTTSVNFRTIVNQTLSSSGRFKRVGRGLYTAK